MRTIDALAVHELRELVAGIQEALWLDVLPITGDRATDLAVDTGGAFDWSSPHDAEAWNPDRAWGSETLDDIARQFERYGLRPEKAQVRRQRPDVSTKGGSVQSEIITIIIPTGMWNDVEGDATCLKCVISICGTLMHLEAIQVHYVGPGRVQEAVSPRFQDDFNVLCRYGSEGQFDTTRINGKSYVLIATPFT
jgi:hypothetical protein